MEAILLLGGPGAGKGTLAEILKTETNYLHVSTGEMFRAAIAAGTPVGLEAKKFIDRGELVPDSVVLGLIEERIAGAPADVRFMFDGFPRTLDQAVGLEKLLKKYNGEIRHVFQLDVDQSVLLKRLTGRRVCRKCAAVFHIHNKPPKLDGVCDADGGELYQRSDDSEETILNRLTVYEKQTAPLIDYYTAAGLLRKIPAAGTPTQIAAAVLKILK